MALRRAWLGKNQWLIGGWPDSVGQMLSATKIPEQPCNLMSGLQSFHFEIYLLPIPPPTHHPPPLCEHS